MKMFQPFTSSKNISCAPNRNRQAQNAHHYLRSFTPLPKGQESRWSVGVPCLAKMDPNILEFICEKVDERVAMRVGPQNIVQFRKLADEKKVHSYLAEKISNLRKVVRNCGKTIGSW
ncbi:uncharacterized protein LOC129739032 [Uranotaenia lowii]|uniref:uncharacterized protein LOC129739032 n=1 Tax=Uranotaenia lowii TaxID=190385 RepID=UPI00247A192F|nr:uncharacterized protein LOC129739032 [Uranotaenia lowii]XP_055586382.1 uncharacterized protein LOC129739032 [Uranotaenia lowii]